MPQGIDVTVAAIIEHESRFLFVEERAGQRLVINQPAGHLEHGESLTAAVVRETLEETGYRFTPTDVVGFYLWHSAEAKTTYLRVAFCGTAKPPQSSLPLDEGIVAYHWLSRGQILSRERQLRSPMVLRCLDDYLAGRRYSLDCLTHLEANVLAPAQAAQAL
jgi:8-oxo-dGTP pyrophosphatase MutT (NUDIX family)